jgi:uridine kinase
LRPSDLHPSDLAARIGPAARVLIDGRSGSGKTTLAAELAAIVPGAQLVRLDDIYPGWDGLQAASDHVVENVLSASRPRWQRWDWMTQQPTDWTELDPLRPIIVEGCGALSRRSAAFADLRVWVELDEPTRKARALARDGDTYAPHWDRWARQEDAFITREHPQQLADVVLEG